MKTIKSGVRINDIVIGYTVNSKNIKIEDSILITDPKNMRKVIIRILKNHSDIYKRDRTIEELVREWKTHNLLYKIPLKFFKEHCKDCDLTLNEGKFRLLVYAVLGRI